MIYKKGTTIRERFFKYVNKEKDCWIWTASKNWQGYGKIGVNYKDYRAHRLSWIIHHGHIPKGKLVLHRCDNPSCVNPNHLYIGNYKDNSNDCSVRGRRRVLVGEETGNSKLTNRIVSKIRNMNIFNLSDQEKVAKRYKIGRSTIRDVIFGRTWKHLL